MHSIYAETCNESESKSSFSYVNCGRHISAYFSIIHVFSLKHVMFDMEISSDRYVKLIADRFWYVDKINQTHNCVHHLSTLHHSIWLHSQLNATLLLISGNISFTSFQWNNFGRCIKMLKNTWHKNSLKNSWQKIRLTIYCTYDVETLATKK